MLYENEDDIMNSYRKLQNSDCLTEKSFTPLETERAYIPYNTMRLDESERGVKENDFGVKFYRNEYKRVVMAHLSLSHDIFFYDT